MKDFLDVVRTRKSVRSFLPEPVSKDIVEKILDVAVEAPTNCNQQLWNFIVIDDPEVKEMLVKEAAGNTLFRRVQTLIVVTYDAWNYKEAMQGASLAVGHILLAATYYGVSASPVNSYGADSKVKNVLGIPDHEAICCFITLGLPDDKAQNAPPVPRKSAKSVTHWNKFEDKPRAPYTYDPNDWSLEELRLHQKHYCRKTSLGKEMDLAGSFERALVKGVLKNKKGPFLDLLSYDGSYIQDFPNTEVESLDLTAETAEYTRMTLVSPKKAHVYDEQGDKLIGNPETITLIYKAERLSDSILQRLLKQAYATLPSGGELIIVARRRISLFSLFLTSLQLICGDDIRRTGIYSFFGPYRPISVSHVIKLARNASFDNISWHGHFAFPSFFEQLYQMIIQYIRSEGSSYLHRDRRNDLISRSISALLSVQGLSRSGILGSVAVITCRK